MAASCLSWEQVQAKTQQQAGLFESSSDMQAIWPDLSAQGWTQTDSTPAAAALTPPPALHSTSTGSCSTPMQVLSVLHQAQQAVPHWCVDMLRRAEAGDRVAALLDATASCKGSYPHRVAPDPSGRITGQPTNKRRLVSGRLRVQVIEQTHASTVHLHRTATWENSRTPGGLGLWQSLPPLHRARACHVGSHFQVPCLSL